MSRKTVISESAQWRERGNAIYREVADGLAPVLQESRLQQALHNYNKAVSLAENDVDRSSAYKNVALTNWKLAKFKANNSTKDTLVMHYYREALESFKTSKYFGRGRSSEWLGSVVSSVADCWAEVRKRIDGIRELEKIVGCVPDDLIQAKEYLHIARTYFHWSVTAGEERNYSESVRLLAQSSFLLKEASRLGSQDKEIVKECDSLEESVLLETCSAESVQARAKGDALLAKITQDNDDHNIEMAWEVVDWYRRAVTLTRERSLVLEAMAYSALGKVYDTVLKMTDRAKSCLRKSLELAACMSPRNFATEEWYQFASRVLERYQQEDLRRYQILLQKKRQEVLATMKEDMERLEQQFDECSHVAFLEFIYAAYPPKNPDHKLEERPDFTNPDTLRKLYGRACVHYHPDHVDEDEHGAQWKVFTEEICKLVTTRYEMYKEKT